MRFTEGLHDVPMTAVRPDLSPLDGRYIRLEPLTEALLPELWRVIGQPSVFAGGFGGGAAGLRDTEPGFVDWARSYFPWQRGNVYAVFVQGGPYDSHLVGTTSLGDFDLANEHSHLGWTAFDPRVWGTQVNAEAKQLLLRLAFTHGFGRVKIQADAANLRSRAAIERLGARFEGIHRRDRKRPDGSWRDTAVYSILTDEWPEVAASLEQRLERFGAQPVLFRAGGLEASA
ncbi:GNAT family protein [Salinibacterium sp. ZJ454]|uniref:GNAT family N-acetyltransferase n=1 Tax=Salinibacterium sp. ZJ454 TaxID=2708339 RepID=UPI0032647007